MPLTKSSYSIITTPRGNGLGVFIDGRDGLLKLKDAVGVIQPMSDYLSSAAIEGYGLVSGGIVTWLGGLDFRISAAQYYIDNQLYNSPTTFVTLSDADPTNPRIDSFAVNTSGQAIVIEGIPAANPQRPSVDPQTQLYLTFVLIEAGATSPSGVTDLDIYKENTEWNWVNVDFDVSNPDYSINPYAGAKSLYLCSNQVGIQTLERGYFWQPIEYNIADYETITFAFYGDFDNDFPSLSIALRTGSNASINGDIVGQLVLSQGDYGIDFTGQSWQLISIPIADLNLQPSNGDTFNSLYIQTNKKGCAQYDNVSFQSGIGQPSNDGLEYFKFIDSDSGSMEATQPSDTFSVVGVGNVSTSITGKVLTIDGSLIPTTLNTADNGISGDASAADPLSFSGSSGLFDQDMYWNLNGYTVGFNTNPTGWDASAPPIRINQFGCRNNFYLASSADNVIYGGFGGDDTVGIFSLIWDLGGYFMQQSGYGSDYYVFDDEYMRFRFSGTNTAGGRNGGWGIMYGKNINGVVGQFAPYFLQSGLAANDDSLAIKLYPFQTYSAITGTSKTTTFDTATVTTEETAQVLRALIFSLQDIGLIK